MALFVLLVDDGDEVEDGELTMADAIDGGDGNGDV